MDIMREESVAGGQAAAAAAAGANSATAFSVYDAPGGVLAVGSKGENVQAFGETIAAAAASAN